MLPKQVTLQKKCKLEFLNEIIRDVGIYKYHFTEFYKKQTIVVRKKIDWTILLIRTMRIIPDKFLKRLSNTDGLWEIRVSVGNGVYRILCFFDNGNLIILLSGFQKKTQKTPKNEIKRAERLKKEYYENK
ncbi:MAG: type II toxin-antitoxin system RelE/ParE family toxin [Bacteroidetes bacterium]|nr:type II toxin-antitoxin system RelE/ParE family toxin [Bacteroidota bacterium]